MRFRLSEELFDDIFIDLDIDKDEDDEDYFDYDFENDFKNNSKSTTKNNFNDDDDDISDFGDFLDNMNDVIYNNDNIEDNKVETKPLGTNEQIGMSEIINSLIKDEYEAISGYNTAIVNLREQGFNEAVKVLTDIQAEENVHVGQLQEIMKMFDSNADKVEQGTSEAEEQLSDVPLNDDSILNQYNEGKLKEEYPDDIDEIPKTAKVLLTRPMTEGMGSGTVKTYYDSVTKKCYTIVE